MKKKDSSTLTGRRAFLKAACGVTGGLMAGELALSGAHASPLSLSAAGAMPVIKLGKHTLSRLIFGTNQIGGYSHRGRLLSKFMTEYYTDDKVVEVFHRCERAGITTHQTGASEQLTRVWKRYRDEGGNMNLIFLSTLKEKGFDDELKLKPIALVHHGEVTDVLWKKGEIDKVRDFIKAVKDKGMLAGVSSHNPDVINYIIDHDWENDFFMTCFYEKRRDNSYWKDNYGFVPLHETYLDTDPARMCDAVRRTQKVCLGFKILAAGRVCDREERVERAFQFAFENIKPTDGVIVGMIPKFKDEITENVAFTKKYGVHT